MHYCYDELIMQSDSSQSQPMDLTEQENKCHEEKYDVNEAEVSLFNNTKIFSLYNYYFQWITPRERRSRSNK